MNERARRALASIRKCVSEDRFALTLHFIERMAQRGLFWPDVQSVIDSSDGVRSDGLDAFGRPKWLVAGDVISVGAIEVACVVEMDESGVEFVTLYCER